MKMFVLNVPDVENCLPCKGEAFCIVMCAVDVGVGIQTAGTPLSQVSAIE